MSDWTDHIPEILSRHDALAAANEDPRLAKSMVRIADHSISMARRMRGHPWAVLVVDQIVAFQINEFYYRLSDRFPTRSALDQAMSTLADVRTHARAIAAGDEPDPDRWPPNTRR